MIIPGEMSLILQSLDVSVNKPFKVINDENQWKGSKKHPANCCRMNFEQLKECLCRKYYAEIIQEMWHQ